MSAAAPWNLRYAAHLGVLTQEQPQFLASVGGTDPLEHMRHIADLGFAGVSDNLLRERPVEVQERMGREAARLGLGVVSFVARRTGVHNLPWHRPGPEARAAILADMRDCLATAQRVRAGVVVASAQADPDLNRAAQVDAYIGHLAAVAPLAERAGVKLGVEPISVLRVPDMLVRHVADAAAIVDRVGHPAVGMVFDTFHVHTMDGDVARRLKEHARRIVAVQIVDCPSRFEPGSGEIDFDAFLSAYRDCGMGHILELEHYHSAPGRDGEQASLRRLRAIDAAHG